MSNDAIALAGLLHDIGKFMLRAGVADRNDWRGNETIGYFGYKHAMLTATFVEELVPNQWRAEVLGPAGYHHKPRTRLDRIVQLADHLSAAERDDGLKDDHPRTEHPKQLLSIFCQVEADDQRLDDAHRRYLPLRPLALSEQVVFPEKESQENEVWRAYKYLWDEFYLQAAELKHAHESSGDLPTYVESMLLLLQRFSWCIPSAYYKNLPDISLYLTPMSRPRTDENKMDLID